MKNLKLVDAQALSTMEMVELNGGCFWCGVRKVVHDATRPVIGRTLAVGGAVTGNLLLAALGAGLLVVK